MDKRIRWSAFSVSVILAIWMAFNMYSRTVNEELWGHRPLVFWSATWLAVIFLGLNKFSPLSNNLKLLAASLLSGLLLSLSWPPLPFFFLLFIGFVPLLWMEDQVSKSNTSGSNWIVAKYAFAGFLTWNILTTFWVTNTLFMGGVVAILPNSILMTIPFVMFHATKKRVGLRLAYAGLVCFWICLELGHLNWKDLSWPWLILGNGFARFPWVVQWYEITGVFGGTLWVWLLNILIYDSWQKTKKWNAKTFGLASIIILIPLAGSLIRYFTYVDQGESVEVVVVQPNYEPHYEKFSVPPQVQMQHFLTLSEDKLTENTQYLVFPETSFGSVWHNNIEKDPVITRFRDFLKDYPKLHLVTGLSSYRRFDDSETKPVALRSYLIGADTVYYEAYNSAMQIRSASEEIDIYLKSKLVPGAEFPPFAAVTKFMKPLVDALGGSMAGLGIQKDRSVFWDESDETAVAPVICYESVFGQYVTRYVQKGAGLLFIVTNDGWWDNTAGHRQHLLYARLRAIETRRSIARSANTGVSAFLDQKGRIFQATNYEEDAVIRRSIAVNDHQTFYVQFGDLIGRLALFTAILIFLVAFVQGRLKKNPLPASS